jgi:hypothetical protein
MTHQPANVHYAATRSALEAWTADPAREPPVAGKFECHVFCAPLNPDPDAKQRFVEACQAADLKPLCLGLDFEGQGVVDVLQTTRYYDCPRVSDAVRLLLRDGEALGQALGPDAVIRLKLEAMANAEGVPQTAAEMQALSASSGWDHYFEFHIKFANPPTPEGDARLMELARELTEELEAVVPFSCNNLADKRQRFLNARTYGLGLVESRVVVERIVAAATERGFKTHKVIEELIVFDTNKGLDRGWLEPRVG